MRRTWMLAIKCALSVLLMLAGYSLTSMGVPGVSTWVTGIAGFVVLFVGFGIFEKSAVALGTVMETRRLAEKGSARGIKREYRERVGGYTVVSVFGVMLMGIGYSMGSDGIPGYSAGSALFAGIVFAGVGFIIASLSAAEVVRVVRGRDQKINAIAC